MQQNPKLHIGYRAFIPDEWIKEITELLSERDIIVTYEKEKSGIYNHFESEWIAAALLFLSGILRDEIRDIVKEVLKSLLKKIRSAGVRIMRSGGSVTDVESGISVSYNDGKGGVLRIHFPKDIDPDLIEKMVDSGVQLIGSEESGMHFENPDYAEHIKDVKIVNMKYNEVDDCWEPINYKKSKEELMERIRKMKS